MGQVSSGVVDLIEQPRSKLPLEKAGLVYPNIPNQIWSWSNKSFWEAMSNMDFARQAACAMLWPSRRALSLQPRWVDWDLEADGAI